MAATVQSVALNYIQHKVQKPSKTLLLAIEQLKQRDNIVITKPDKGSGVVVMDKSEYLQLLSEASINDSSKFWAVPLDSPSSKGRPPTYYHPLLQKEKELESIVRRILPKPIADMVRPTGTRCAFVWFTKDTQGLVRDAPRTISTVEPRLSGLVGTTRNSPDNRGSG